MANVTPTSSDSEGESGAVINLDNILDVEKKNKRYSSVINPLHKKKGKENPLFAHSPLPLEIKAHPYLQLLESAPLL